MMATLPRSLALMAALLSRAADQRQAAFAGKAFVIREDGQPRRNDTMQRQRIAVEMATTQIQRIVGMSRPRQGEAAHQYPARSQLQGEQGEKEAVGRRLALIV